MKHGEWTENEQLTKDSTVNKQSLTNTQVDIIEQQGQVEGKDRKIKRLETDNRDHLADPKNRKRQIRNQPAIRFSICLAEAMKF